MDSVVHFEIPADDPKRASAFYKKAFGWTAEEFQGMGYWMLGTTEVDEKTRMPKTWVRSMGVWLREVVPSRT